MTATLASTGVLVTRPATQAARLCELITERGGRETVEIVIFVAHERVTAVQAFENGLYY